MPTSFEELENSPLIAVEEGRLSARRMFLIAWDDWPTFIGELYGAHLFSGGAWHYTPPATFPNDTTLVARRIHVEPFPADRPSVQTIASLTSATNRFPFAKVTVGYERLPASDVRGPSVPNGTYLEILSDLAAEYVTVPGRNWRWRNAPQQKLADDVAPGLLVPCEDLHLRWTRVPLPPWSAIRSLRGKINSDDFLGNARGTVLFLGAKVRHDFQVIDTGLWQVDLHFKIKEPGWNYAFKQDAGWQVIEDGGGQTPYVEAGLGGLLSLG
jgi:hypothetical protein